MAIKSTGGTFNPRKPDWSISALVKSTNQRGPVGVGWTQPDGSIRIKINEFVTLTGGPDVVITMFPKTDHPKAKAGGDSATVPSDDAPAHEYF